MLRVLEPVTLDLVACLPLELPSRAQSTEDRLSPVALVPHPKISSLAKLPPRALELVKALENKNKKNNS